MLKTYFDSNDCSCMGHRLKSLKIKWHATRNDFQLNHVIILQLRYTFLDCIRMKIRTWLCRTKVKRSTRGMSFLQYLFSGDFYYSYHKILPWRTEGLSDSSTLAMSLQTSPNWRKNWIKFRAFRSISESFHSEPFPVVIRDLGTWANKGFSLVKKTMGIHSGAATSEIAWKTEMQSWLLGK